MRTQAGQQLKRQLRGRGMRGGARGRKEQAAHWRQPRRHARQRAKQRRVERLRIRHTSPEGTASPCPSALLTWAPASMPAAVGWRDQMCKDSLQGLCGQPRFHAHRRAQQRQIERLRVQASHVRHMYQMLAIGIR